MTKAKLSATCAAAVLSCVVASAQTPPPGSTGAAATQDNRGRAPDKPQPNSDAAESPHTATISGCVVRDAANGGQASIASNGISYRLTGKSEKEFQRYLGKRIEVTGPLASGSTGARATGGRTEERTGALSDAERGGVPLATDKGTTADLTARIRVNTIKMIAPNCL